MFFEQLKRLCALKGTTPTALVKRLGLSPSNVTTWKNGTSPKLDVLEKLAAGLDVPVNAFLGADVQPEPALQPDEEELLETYRQLGKSGKRQLIGKAYELLDAQSAHPSGDRVTPPNIDMVTPVMDGRMVKK